MEANKIDNLFRGNLENSPTTPSPDSWGKLETMMARKKRGIILWYYKIAAVGLLLLCSIYFTITYSTDIVNERKVASSNSVPAQDSVYRLSEKQGLDLTYSLSGTQAVDPANQPNVADRNALQSNNNIIAKNVPDPINNGTPKLIADANERVIEKTTDENNSVVVISKESNNDEPLDQANQVLNLERQAIADVSIENPDKVDAPSKRMPIKIIYKRGTRDEALIAQEKSISTDTTRNGSNFFKSILNKKRGFANGDLFADIREAKTNFFHHGIDIKNSKIKNSK